MSIANFLRPRFVGERFKDHAIPLDLLGDLAVLEAMIIEVAKWRYLQDHRDRRRSPRKFSDGVSLTLTAVDEGSAVPVLALTLAVGVEGLLPPFQQDYLIQARDAVVQAIGAATENKPPTTYLPAKGLAYFDRLGRSLLEGEAIEFPTAMPGSPARLTKETRLRLLRAAEIKEWSEEVHLRGAVHAVDQDKMIFEIMLLDGRKVPGPLAEPHYDAIIEAFQGFRQGVKVLLDGVGQYSRSERLQKIESIDHITLLDLLDVQTQLEELKLLKDGWYDGRGLAPPSDGLDWLIREFDERYPDSLALPYIYPVAEGGVRLEWAFKRQDVSLEVDLHERSGEYHSLDLETDREEARSLNLNRDADWRWMFERLHVESKGEA